MPVVPFAPLSHQSPPAHAPEIPLPSASGSAPPHIVVASHRAKKAASRSIHDLSHASGRHLARHCCPFLSTRGGQRFGPQTHPRGGSFAGVLSCHLRHTQHAEMDRQQGARCLPAQFPLPLPYTEQRGECVLKGSWPGGRVACITESNTIGAGRPCRLRRLQGNTQTFSCPQGQQPGHNHKPAESHRLPERTGLNLEKHNRAVCLVVSKHNGSGGVVPDRHDNALARPVLRRRELDDHPLASPPRRRRRRSGGRSWSTRGQTRNPRWRPRNTGHCGGSACRRRYAIVPAARQQEAQGQPQEYRSLHTHHKIPAFLQI